MNTDFSYFAATVCRRIPVFTKEESSTSCLLSPAERFSLFAKERWKQYEERQDGLRSRRVPPTAGWRAARLCGRFGRRSAGVVSSDVRSRAAGQSAPQHAAVLGGRTTCRLQSQGRPVLSLRLRTAAVSLRWELTLRLRNRHNVS